MWKVGILGAGYIARHHAKALKGMSNVKIQAVCDLNAHNCKSIADQVGNINTYSSLQEMLRNEKLDSVHVLLPPDLHFQTSKEILNQGVHLFLEKPMCVDPDECLSLANLADEKRVKIGVNHNFLYFDVYQQLKKACSANELGPLDHLTITWHKTLGQLHSGPFNIWMLRDPRNLLMEIGPHLVGCLIDLVGEPERLHVECSDPITLPTGVTIFRRWVVLGYVKGTCVEMRISLTEGFDEHTIEARGKIGSAKIDFERNTFVLNRHAKFSRPIDLFLMARSEARQLLRSARMTLGRYLLNKVRISKKGEPYFDSIAHSISSFYANIDGKIDSGQSADFSTRVIRLCTKIAEQAEVPVRRPQEHTKPANASEKNKADLLVIGGTGFIGKALVRQLLAEGRSVRMLVRNPGSLHGITHTDRLEVVRGDIRDRASLKAALEGVKVVYHLARANGNQWSDYWEQGVNPTRILGEECLAADIKRLIYTGTIDSYFAGASGHVISEATPLDPQIVRRNYYARAKALEESLLMQMHREQNLPLVIVRPGIVLGKESNPFHWGVGMWRHGSICQLWGDGTNPLPFVLVDDVVRALIACMDKPNIEGESFNLIDAPCLTGKEYVAELSRATQARIDIQPTAIWKFYLNDLGKWVIKSLIRHPNRKMPAYRDWVSRTQLSTFDASKAQNLLNWQPAANKEKLIEEGIRKPAADWYA